MRLHLASMFSLAIATVGPNAIAATALENAVTVGPLTGAAGSTAEFTLDVPSDAVNLKFTIGGGSGDADLYVKFNEAATVDNWDCRPFATGNNENCSIETAQQGTYHVMLRGYSDYSGLNLVGQYNLAGEIEIGQLEKGVAVDNISGIVGSEMLYKISVPENAMNLNVAISGGSGDADLYLNPGEAPTLSTYVCRPWQNGNNESCSVQSPEAGEYFVMLRGYAAYQNLTLLADYTISDGTTPTPTPTPPPTPTPDPGNGNPCEPDADQQALLDAHNAARATARQCNGVNYPAAPPLTWSCQLATAATNHNADMASNGVLSHVGSNGSTLGQRITATGYNWGNIAENIARGQTTVDQVMQAWLTSTTGHCKNIMDAARTEYGGSKIDGGNGNLSIFWTSVFARPLN